MVWIDFWNLHEKSDAHPMNCPASGHRSRGGRRRPGGCDPGALMRGQATATRVTRPNCAAGPPPGRRVLLAGIGQSCAEREPRLASPAASVEEVARCCAVNRATIYRAIGLGADCRLHRYLTLINSIVPTAAPPMPPRATSSKVVATAWQISGQSMPVAPRSGGLDSNVTDHMRSGPDQRSRGRFNPNRPLRPQPRAPQSSQAFDGNGPDVRVRGTAQQVFERYVVLAREAASSGDRIAAENYYQHAEHYFRINDASRDCNSQETTPADAAMSVPETGSSRTG
jgi:hypothetical protein